MKTHACDNAEYQTQVLTLVAEAEAASICLSASIKAYNRLRMIGAAKSLRLIVDRLDTAIAPFVNTAKNG